MRCINKMARKSLVGMVLLLISAFVGHATAQTCVQPPAGLVSWWPGDGDANDIISSNNGTFESGVTFVPGKVDQAFSFDGTEGVKVQDDPTLNLANAITVSAWVNRASTTYASPIVKKAGEGTNQQNGFALEFGGFIQNSVYFWVYIPGVGWRSSGGYPVANNVWTHVVGTYDGTNLKVYVDGALGSYVSLPPGTIAPSGNPLYIGRDPANLGRVYHGLIDEPSIYNRALSPAEIQAIFNAGSAGKCKVQTVIIDIKPGSFPNSINLSSAGVVAVAILSSDTFDANTVDPDTISLAGASVKMVGKSGKSLCHVEEVNGDDFLDLVCQVLTEELLIELGDSVAVLEAETFDGTLIRGEDSVNIVPDK